ncbi:MarR family winged helix-turn-helix transcriptional regulator [Nocardioides mangrovi]|uniref:MarR family winged helix-turn-helix transcriptional regulator n=1 Tax=Nocardioides mangrovi TaxID=2874580 RepID=A0ABS7UDX0_9ACTN|nr:MarR family winged helix-turn-helix transcriptional regulator [Nocardioides mangrovi]MBZ5739010.1 MarR family winged helix-turn-helix transcriptional regulator [Nocardioides mangrovi]
MEPLTDADAELWAAWVAASEALAQVSTDVAEATGLSEPDVTVLMCLQQADGARLRQSDLATTTGWHRSRLSHHLKRMAERGLVNRTEVPGGVEVRLTTMGRAAAARARPVHADAVRRHLVAPLPSRDRERLVTILRRLTAPGS